MGRRIEVRDNRPSVRAKHATRRGVCPKCGRPLKHDRAKFNTATATWTCSCGYQVVMPKASVLYRRARLEVELAGQLVDSVDVVVTIREHR